MSSKFSLITMSVKEESMNLREDQIIRFIKQDKNISPKTIKYLVSKIMENRK